MSNTQPGLKLKKSNHCPVCAGAMDELIDLSGLPMTEQFEPYTEVFDDTRGRIDNAFLYCEPCGHGKLETVVPAEMLYSKNYRTKTSASVGASHSVDGFFGFINRSVDLAQYDCVIDIGGNDGSLLSLFRTTTKVNVDPNGQSGDGLVLMGYIEDVDLQDFKAMKKVIVSSHTLEHLESPEILFEKVSGILCHDDVCAFQFPSLDCLVRDARIDQIHHQHVHYFSLRSVSLLLAKYSLEIVAYEFDEAHYGTLRIVFKRGQGEMIGLPIKTFEIEQAHNEFISETICFDERIQRLREPVGYGAALMLPLLRFYVPDLERLQYIYDEDASKHGLRWINLNKQIKAPEDVRGRDVVVTAFNTKLAVRKIAAKLSDAGARNIVVPFHAL